jgi:hypothetical protein
MGVSRLRQLAGYVAVSADADLGGYPCDGQGVTLNHASLVDQGRVGTPVSREAAMAAGEGKMMSWFWRNIPLMVLVVCCWAGIPLWHVLTRWDAELKVKHADVGARAVAAPVWVQPAPAGCRKPATGPAASEQHLGLGAHRSSSSARRRSLTAPLRIVTGDARGDDPALPGLLRQFRLGG